LKIDAQIALAVSIGVEVVLFFTFGGLTQLRHLQHLKYVTKIRAALGGTLPATEEVLVWSGLHAGSQTLSVTSAMIFSLGQYNATILPTAAEREAREKANMAFLYLTLVFAGGSVLFRYKAVEAAEYALLDTTATLSMNPDVKNVMIALVGEYSTVLSNFSTRLSNLPLDDINKIATRFESFADDIMKQRAFYKDFGHLDDTSQLNVWNTMNKASVLDNWEALYELRVLERNELSILSRTNIRNAYVRYYGEPILRETLERSSLYNRLAFFEDFGERPPEWFNHLIDNPSAIERWNKLDSSARLFAKSKPDVWLYTFDRLYENFGKWNRLTDAEILQRFGQKGLDLVNEVEAFALNHITITGANQLKLRDILISGMKDKNANLTSDFFTNFTKNDFIEGGAYHSYLNDMFPNLKRRIDNIVEFNQKNYNMADIEYLGNTGKYPGAHAEVRALNHLAKQKFPNYLSTPPSDEVFDAWLKNDVLGYNRNIQHGAGQQNVIMHTCADCYHILDLVTFIKPL
jgi:peroxiredoxin family protein